MKALLSQLNLHHKLIASFAIMLCILTLLGISSMFKLSSVNEVTATIVHDIQPTIIAVEELSTKTVQATSALGFYLLDKDPAYLEEYAQLASQLKETLRFLKASEFINQDESNRTLVNHIAATLSDFKKIKPKVIDAAESNAKNLPATLYASEHINPLAREISQILSEMIQVEEAEEATPDRKQILADINNLRFAWTAMLNEMRLYLAFRTPSAKQNMEVYNLNVYQRLETVKNWGDLLTFEQEMGVEQIAEKLDQYKQHVPELIKIHESDKWRIDAWLIRTQINPQIHLVMTDISKLVKSLQATSEAANSKVDSIYQDGKSEIIATIIISLILMTLMGWLLIKSIRSQLGSDPKELLHITRAISEGNLNSNFSVKNPTGVSAAILTMQENLRSSIEKEREVSHINGRIKEALDNVSSNVMLADTSGVIIFVNKAIKKMMAAIEPEMKAVLTNFDSSNLLGTNFNQFHSSSSQLGSESELKATRTADVPIGRLSLRVVENPVYDESGLHIGTVAEWQDRTQEVAIETEIQDIVNSAKAGDLSRRIDLSIQEGFTHRLSDGINQLLKACDDSITETVHVMGSVAQGDLTQKINSHFDGTFGQLKDDVNATICKLTEVMDEINNSASSVLSSSQEIAQGNVDLSHRTEQQAASLEQTASSMEEMTATVRQNADNAKQANQLAADTREQAEQGGKVVNQAITAMTGITESSNKIAAIIGVIDEIAFQTNLLALNAAVEAARAGEQGRGFAVVASEVRNLAGRSAEAAKEIKNLIQDSAVKVEQGSKLVDASGQTLGEIMTSVKKVSDIIAEITAASFEQSDGIGQVNKAITQMDEMTQQNAALVEEAAAASLSMGEQAGKLSKMVGFFKTGDGAANMPVTERRQAERPWAGQPAAAHTQAMPATQAKKVSAAGNATSSAADNNEWEEF